LNSGPGALAGAFVHEKHFGASRRGELPRLEGWWSNDPKTRFLMRPEVERAPGAEAWAVSNPPILAAAPLRASLDIFDEATMGRVREKGRAMTEFLGGLLEEIGRAKPGMFEVVTPREWERRGAQFSVRLAKGAKEMQRALLARGVTTDFREPDIIRLAPAPLYNTFADCARFAGTLAGLM
jgi:kynureninase